MKLVKTKIKDLFILKPTIFEDERGSFIESYNQEKINKIFGQTRFVQDNESESCRGVLRGLHFQIPPYSQAKLVRCIRGEILDVAVDLRKKSKTYGLYEKTLLSYKNKNQLFIPKGFAHGFIVLSRSAIVSYKVDNYYNPEYESGILWSDIDLNIDWEMEQDKIILSLKDKNLLPFSKTRNPF